MYRFKCVRVSVGCASAADVIAAGAPAQQHAGGGGVGQTDDG